MLDTIKAFLDKYNISVTIIGTAVVLSTMFGQCSYDLSSGEIAATNEVVEVVEVEKAPEVSEEVIAE